MGKEHFSAPRMHRTVNVEQEKCETTSPGDIWAKFPYPTRELQKVVSRRSQGLVFNWH